MTLDSKLHWTPHINEKLDKAKKYLGKVACMTRNNWGPKPRLMRWAYLGIVRPMLCYGSMIWGHRAPELLSKFRRLNRMAINTFANFPRSTPTVALEVMLDIEPLHLFCIQEAIAARVRLDRVLEFGWDGLTHTKTHAVSHMRFLQEKLMKLDIDPGNSDRCSKRMWNNGFRINRDSFDGAAKHRRPSQYNIFTDGSKLEDRTGSGIAIYKGTREIASDSMRLPDGTTVFQAEVAAVARAAEMLNNAMDTGVKYVKIFIDSQAAITALGNVQISSSVVEEAVKNLNELAEKANSVTLVWIPAHKGYAGNERADELAKAGSRLEEASSLITVGLPQATVRRTVRMNTREEWQKEWDESQIAKHTKGFYGGPRPGKAKFVYKLSRLELGRFVRIITGHNNLGFFQTKIGLSNGASCRFCGEGDETVTHFMTACPGLTTRVKDIFLDKLPTSDMKWSVRDLLNFSFFQK